MAHGKRSTDRCAGKELPPSLPASKEVLYYVDPNGVITWPKPIKEPCTDAFWRKYFFPPQIRVAFPSSSSHFVAYTDMVRGQMNFTEWPKIHISKRLRFHLPLLINQFLHYTQIHLVYVHVNIIRVLLGVCVLNKRLSLRLGLEEVMFAYSFKRHKLDRYYLVDNCLVIGIATKDSSKSLVKVPKTC